MKQAPRLLPIPRIGVVIAAVVAAVALPGSAAADHGPKPSQDFTLVYTTSHPVTLIDGQLLQCGDPECAQAHPLESLGPQRFACQPSACLSVSYSDYALYQKLVLRFDDRTRTSNVFQHRSKAFSTTYTVTVTDDQLLVEENASLNFFFSPYQLLLFVPAFLVTIVLELGVAAIALRLMQRLRGRTLAWVALANSISLPVVWFVFPLLPIPALAIVALSELFAVTFEVFVLALTSKATLSTRQIIILSVAMNAVSFFFGFCGASVA